VRVLWARARSDRGLCAVIRATELTAVEVWSGPAGVGEGGGVLLEARTSPMPASWRKAEYGSTVRVCDRQYSWRGLIILVGPAHSAEGCRVRNTRNSQWCIPPP
jgi:hypothetical protein